MSLLVFREKSYFKQDHPILNITFYSAHGIKQESITVSPLDKEKRFITQVIGQCSNFYLKF